MTRTDFVNKYSPLVKTLSTKSGLFPEIVFAQAFVESSDSTGKFGNGYVAKEGNNYFAIKPGASWKGATITNPFVRTEANVFRKYNSIEDSIKDYFAFLTQNKRYQLAGVFKAKTADEQAEALERAGYAGNNNNYSEIISKVADGARKLLGSAKTVASGNYGKILYGIIVVGGIIYLTRKK